MVTAAELGHLRRCIELAIEARDRGDEPFGSVLVGGDGAVLAEQSNSINTDRDVTAHPELWLAAWAAHNLSPEECAAATMYTSGEHCPMCAAAHFWAGIGRLVFVMSSEQLARKCGPDRPSLDLSTRQLFALGNRSIEVVGPVDELVDEVLAVFE